MRTSIIVLSIIIFMLVMFSCKQASTPVPVEANVPAAVPTLNWQDISQAQAMATEQQKDIFVFVYAPWCPKCEAMRLDAFQNDELINVINTHFIPVQINAQENKDILFKGRTFSNPEFDATRAFTDQNSYHEILYEIGAESIPNVVVLDKNVNNIGSILGLRDPKILRSFLSNTTGRF